MEPLLISENFVARFKFWLNGQVQEGMRHREELFRCLQTETIHGRQRIYDLGWALAQEGVHTIISASKGNYTLWISLRSMSELENASNLGILKSTVGNHSISCMSA